MAISINCATKVVFVPKADLTLVSPGIYSLDVEAFRIWLKDWEDSEIGMGMPDTHRRNAPSTLSGTTYAQTFEMINGYTVTFEDGSYRVRVVGANHNIADVMNANSVSIEIGNSAGLITVETGVSGLTVAESAALSLIEKLLRNKQITNPATGKMTVYDDDGTTVLVEGNLYQDAAGVTPYAGAGAERRERLA